VWPRGLDGCLCQLFCSPSPLLVWTYSVSCPVGPAPASWHHCNRWTHRPQQRGKRTAKWEGQRTSVCLWMDVLPRVPPSSPLPRLPLLHWLVQQLRPGGGVVSRESGEHSFHAGACSTRQYWPDTTGVSSPGQASLVRKCRLRMDSCQCSARGVVCVQPGTPVWYHSTTHQQSVVQRASNALQQLMQGCMHSASSMPRSEGSRLRSLVCARASDGLRGAARPAWRLQRSAYCLKHGAHGNDVHAVMTCVWGSCCSGPWRTQPLCTSLCRRGRIWIHMSYGQVHVPSLVYCVILHSCYNLKFAKAPELQHALTGPPCPLDPTRSLSHWVSS
jgi:hypothetical protein